MLLYKLQIHFILLAWNCSPLWLIPTYSLVFRHHFLLLEVFPDTWVPSLPCPTFLCAPIMCAHAITIAFTLYWNDDSSIYHLPVNIPFLLSLVSILAPYTQKILVFEMYCNKALIQQNWMNDNLISCCKLKLRGWSSIFLFSVFTWGYQKMEWIFWFDS